MLRQILALAFIFVCTSIAWVILGTTIFSRTYGSNEQLQGRVASTWGTAQQQSPPSATYTVTEVVSSTTVEDGKVIVHSKNKERQVPLPVEASRIHVNLHLTPRQKGLLWYSTYAVDFAGDYTFRNNTAQAQTVDFRLKFPAQKAIYDELQMKVNQRPVALATDDQGTVAQATVDPGETASLHVAHRSQGVDSWRYQLGDGSAQLAFYADDADQFPGYRLCRRYTFAYVERTRSGRLATHVAILEPGLRLSDRHDDAAEAAAGAAGGRNQLCGAGVFVLLFLFDVHHYHDAQH